MKPLRLTMLLCLVLAACTKPALPVLGEISEFHLTTQEGRSFSKSDMAGKIWVANFIFTSCAGTCPLLTERMKKLQTSLNAGMENPERAPLHFVSFSVDPERDTPEVLQEYAKRHDVDLSNWTFLTGPFEEVSRTVVKGFKVSMGKVPVSAETAGVEEIFEVVHGEQFLLIDGKGRIRGYYATEDGGVQILQRDIMNLIRRDE